MRTLITLAVVLTAVSASSAANAVSCYKLLDRSDKLLYQNSLPPVDMSDQGAAAREDFRRRNEYLLVSEAVSCPPIAAVEGTSGYRPASVNEIVSQMRSFLSSGGAGSGSRTGVYGSAGTSAPARAPSAAAPSAPRRGY